MRTEHYWFHVLGIVPGFCGVDGVLKPPGSLPLKVLADKLPRLGTKRELIFLISITLCCFF